MRSSLLAALAVAFVSVGAGTAAAQSLPPGVYGPYVALGDSYSSGEGNSPYMPGGPGRALLCHRSKDDAYPHRVLGGVKPENFRACSGARLPAFYETNEDYGQEISQSSWLDASTGFVTITLGGNDLDFEGILKNCVSVVRTQQVLWRTVSVSQRRNPFACNRKLEAAEEDVSTSWREKLHSLYQDLLYLAPNAQIRVLTYPRLFNSKFTGINGRCIVAGARLPLRVPYNVSLRLGFERDAVRDFENLEAVANAVIVQEVNAVRTEDPANAQRLQVVDVASLFDTHTVGCGDSEPADPWIRGVRTDTAALLAVMANDVRTFNAIFHASFHPTAAGQRAMADAVNKTFVTAPTPPSNPTGPAAS